MSGNRYPKIPNESNWIDFFEKTSKADLMEICMYLALKNTGNDSFYDAFITLKIERESIRLQNKKVKEMI